MTIVVPFNPSPLQPVQFFATLDGSSYSVTIRWNLSRQWWYIFVDDSDGVNIVTRPLIGSPDGYDISLVGGYFTSTLVYRPSSESFEISP